MKPEKKDLASAWGGGMGIDRPIILGRYSNSQNGTIISPLGIAPCFAGGGKGHDTDKPKILLEYYTDNDK